MTASKKEVAMDPQKLPDHVIEVSAAPGAAADKPLDEKEIKVTKVNRMLLRVILAVLFASVALTIMLGLSQTKKLAAQEMAEQAARNDAASGQRPSLPGNVAAAKGMYSDISKPGVAGVQQPAGPAGDGQRTAGPVTPSDAASSGAGGTASLLGVQLTPEQRAFQVRREQIQKDSINANRAPVAFEGKEVRSQDQAPAREVGPNPPDLSGVTRMLDRLPGGLGTAGSDDDQNRQAEKKGFTRESRDDFPYLKTSLLTPISQYEVKAGSIIPGVLLTGINSDLPGQITAQVRENVYDTVSGRYLLIPQGARLIGEYDSKISYGQERVLVVWTRIIMPNGNSIGLEGMPGVDLSGYAGTGGTVNNHYGKLVTGVVLGSVIGAGAQVATGGQGAPNVPPSFGQLAVAGAATNLNQAGQQITQRNLNVQPTIEISPGQKINVFLTKDMILRPYTD